MRLLTLSAALLAMTSATHAESPWKKQIIDQGRHTTNVVAADFTGDGHVDVMANSAGATRLFVGPKWTMQVVDQTPEHDAIHAEVLDVDNDGDPDFIGSRYSPGLIYWVETQRGDAEIYVRNWRDSAYETGAGRWQILSVDGLRFTIPDINALDARSQDLLDQVF